MKSLLFTAALLVALSSTISALHVTDAPSADPRICKGTPNTIDVHSEAPTFVKSVPNGKLYTAGQGNDTFAVVHVWGTPYEQGFANGQLRSEAVNSMWGPFIGYMNSRILAKEKKHHDKDGHEIPK